MSTAHENEYQAKAVHSSTLTSSSQPILTMTMTSDAQPVTDQESDSGYLKATESPCVCDSSNEESKDASNTNAKIDDDNAAGSTGSENAKRFLPAYKKANAALTFPEKVRNHKQE